jgi:CRP/FNR family transcriptional regulator
LDLFRDGMLLLGRKCSYERVAGFLFMMAAQACRIGVRPQECVHFELPLTRTEMADYLGLTLETVCRQLSRLRKKEVIALPSGRNVVVRDLELLRAEAHFERCSGDLDEGSNRTVA